MVGDRSVNDESASFRRYLSAPFLDALERLIDQLEGQWWRDVLAHPDLFLAIRNNALAAYYRGALIFNAVSDGAGIVPQTHFKYLVRQRQAYVELGADGRFALDPSKFMWTQYEPKATLKEMMQAANAYAGVEKTGLHALITVSENVIDVEASFWRREPDTGNLEPARDTEGTEADVDDFLAESSAISPTKTSRRLDRIDAVSLEDRDGALWLVFHEAKHFSNKELRGSDARPPLVAAQIDRYRQAIKTYTPDILASYADVCRALVRIDAMRAGQAGSDPSTLKTRSLIARAAKGEPLHIDPNPRLIIYGFDKAQRDHDTWRDHYRRLTDSGLTIYAIGDPRQAGHAAFARR